MILFHALGDSTRWHMVERLSVGPASVSELAKPFGLTLPGAMQHLRILEEAKLVRSEKIGRVRLCHIRPEWIEMVDVWIRARQASMQGQLDMAD